MDGTLLERGRTGLATTHGDFVAHELLDLRRREPFLAITAGDVRGAEPLLARVHSSCVTSEAFAALDCDCAEQLEAALAAIARAGRGVVFYLLQEGRGAGFVAKTRDRMLVQASGDKLTTFEAYAAMGIDHDLRRYDEVPAAVRLLGIEAPLRLLTNNPEKAGSLAELGLRLVATVPLEQPSSPFNVHYLGAKSRSGHRLPHAGHDDDAAAIPDRVEAIDPEPIGSRDLLRVATYLLPVRALRRDEPAWFRSHVYYDVPARTERVALELHGGTTPLLRLEPETLLARFPLRGGRPWPRAAARLAAEGGVAIFLPRESAEDDGLAEAELRVLADRLPAKRVRPLLDGPHPTAAEAARLARLEAAGFALEPPAALA